jgi:hypothetical protein
VYRSDDSGKSWKLMSGDDRLTQRLFSTYGWVFGQIRVDPNNEDTIYTMGIPLLKSTDGGESFKSLNYPGLHGDHHAMWINPENSNHVINGNDGGVNLSYDGGATWKTCQSYSFTTSRSTTLNPSTFTVRFRTTTAGVAPPTIALGGRQSMRGNESLAVKPARWRLTPMTKIRFTQRDSTARFNDQL